MSEIPNISVIVFNNCNNQQIYEKFNVHQVVHDYPSQVCLSHLICTEQSQFYK